MFMRESQLERKDEEKSSLKLQLASRESSLRCDHGTSTVTESVRYAPADDLPLIDLSGSDMRTGWLSNVRTQSTWTGKALPIDMFTGENIDVTWEDWLPLFEQAAHWNAWTEVEKLLQMAGYFRKKAFWRGTC